jgi:hypothetical protein
MGEVINTYSFVRKPKVKRPLARPRHRYEKEETQRPEFASELY